MKVTLRQQLTQFDHVLQTRLFSILEEEMGELDAKARQLVAILEMIPLARFVPASRGWIGRPCKDRLAIASAFVAKAVYGFGLTRQLLERLQQDEQLRRICGWETARQAPQKRWCRPRPGRHKHARPAASERRRDRSNGIRAASRPVGRRRTPACIGSER